MTAVASAFTPPARLGFDLALALRFGLCLPFRLPLSRCACELSLVQFLLDSAAVKRVGTWVTVGARCWEREVDPTSG